MPRTSLAPPPVQSRESKWSCICVLSVSILPLSTTFLFAFGTIPTVWYFSFCIFFVHDYTIYCANTIFTETSLKCKRKGLFYGT